jgi:hypothetical protein
MCSVISCTRFVSRSPLSVVRSSYRSTNSTGGNAKAFRWRWNKPIAPSKQFN